MTLELFPTRVDFHRELSDSNAAYFAADEGYFVVETCVYLEDDSDDSRINDRYFEYCDQINGQAGGLESVTFYDRGVELRFQSDRLFMGKYMSVALRFRLPVPKELVEFFNNALFLGEYIGYDSSFPQEKIVKQTQFRDCLE